MKLNRYLTQLTTGGALTLLLAFALVAFGLTTGYAQEIGDQARQRAEEVKSLPKEVTTQQVENVIGLVQKLGGVLLVLVLALLIVGARLVNFDPFGKISANKAHGWLWLLFGVAFFGFIGWQIASYTHMPMLTHGAASAHGQEIDSLFTMTLIITGFIFVLVHVALFYYAWAYRGRPGMKALFYPDNHKLETIWTIIPAIGISVMVIYGVTIWTNINDPAHTKGDDVIQIEIVGEQFQWRLRYPGQDRTLGKHKFRLISSENPVGVDVKDPKSMDDVVPQVKEIHLPIGAKVNLNIRAKDVLHGVYLPHFRVNLYAVPGAPSNFAFTPTKTTAEMRKETGKPDFNYELACSQLCGSSHWNMRAIVVVESQEEYQKWLASQPTIASTLMNQTPAEGEDAQASAVRP